MEQRKPRSQDIGSTQKPKRVYFIGLLSKNELGESVILNPSPVQFFSDLPAPSAGQTLASRTKRPVKQNGQNSKALKPQHGESNSSSGEQLGQAYSTFTKDLPPI